MNGQKKNKTYQNGWCAAAQTRIWQRTQAGKFTASAKLHVGN
jgi:hypothetical protein